MLLVDYYGGPRCILESIFGTEYFKDRKQLIVTFRGQHRICRFLFHH